MTIRFTSLVAATRMWLQSRRRRAGNPFADLEKVFGLSCLAVIPFEAQPGSGPCPGTSGLTASSGAVSNVTECFLGFRDAVLNASSNEPPQIILLTSARPDEGKTTLSLRLARALAHGGARVLLLEADLRRPALHRCLSLNAGRGLSSVLAGSALLQSVIQPAASAFDVLLCGPVPPQPVEMLRSPAMATVLQACRETYQHIVIDTPPLLSVADALVLAPHADAVVLVARPGKASPRALKRVCDLLAGAGARLAGYVLNAV